MPKPLSELKPSTLRRKLRQAKRELIELTAIWRAANRDRAEANSRIVEESIRTGAASQKALDAMRLGYARLRELEELLGLEPSATPAPRHYYYP